MNINDNDLAIERIRGQGPGGQHRNKTASCVRITHLPTGIQVTVDGRNQHANLRKAKKELVRRIQVVGDRRAAEAKKADRDRKVASSVRVRTYDQNANRVVDHRTNMRRQFDDVVRRGDLQDLMEGYLADL